MGNKSLEQKFNSLVHDLKKEPNVLGLFLGGTRGKGFETGDSDYDLYVVVKDKTKFYKKPIKGIDLPNYGLSEFKKEAIWGSDSGWERYNFSRVKILKDSGGMIAHLLKQKAIIPKAKIKKFVAYSLDAYLNATYRSLKYWGKDKIGNRFEAAEAIRYLLDALFGLEGRHMPYYGYLAKELGRYPLKNLPWKPRVFLSKILNILNSGSPTLQRSVLKTTEKVFRRQGFNKVFDGWKGYKF